ncbi:WcaA Glycosyltransferases involved in cell wall biogenesis [Candidatus Nanopelagicaceae bacterium]
MYEGKTVAVVIPCYNEELHVREVVETLPEWIDLVVAIDDASGDRTNEVLESLSISNPKLYVIRNSQNKGVGGSIKVGYRFALSKGIDIFCVMAGDGQMDPEFLEMLVSPISDGIVKITKGNRFYSTSSMKGMPVLRIFGNVVLTFLTKIASGYYELRDPQNGYVCTSRQALESIELESLEERYDFENDFLCKAGAVGLPLMDVNIPAKYENEKSTMVIHKTAPRISKTLLKGFFRRIFSRVALTQRPELAALVLWNIFFWIMFVISSAWISYHSVGNKSASAGTIGADLVILILSLFSTLLAIIVDSRRFKY